MLHDPEGWGSDHCTHITSQHAKHTIIQALEEWRQENFQDLLASHLTQKTWTPVPKGHSDLGVTGEK